MKPYFTKVTTDSLFVTFDCFLTYFAGVLDVARSRIWTNITTQQQHSKCKRYGYFDFMFDTKCPSCSKSNMASPTLVSCITPKNPFQSEASWSVILHKTSAWYLDFLPTVSECLLAQNLALITSRCSENRSTILTNTSVSQPSLLKENPPCPVIARLTCWKQKEAILKAAREVKPKEIRFFQDLSAGTLQRRADQIPKLIAEREKGNTAYFIVDKLVVHDRKNKSWFQDIVIWLWRHCPMEWTSFYLILCLLFMTVHLFFLIDFNMKNW